MARPPWHAGNVMQQTLHVGAERVVCYTRSRGVRWER